MTTVLKYFMWVLILMVILCLGCTESQLQQADKVIQDVNSVGRVIQNIIELPTVKVIPHPYILIASTVVGGLLGGVKVWKRIRKNQY